MVAIRPQRPAFPAHPHGGGASGRRGCALPVTPPPVIDPDALLERVRTNVDLVLQTHLEATVANAMLDQVAVIVARIREEIEPMVRQAVAEAVASELEAANPG
jgi:hypothetical protein